MSATVISEDGSLHCVIFLLSIVSDGGEVLCLKQCGEEGNGWVAQANRTGALVVQLRMWGNSAKKKSVEGFVLMVIEVKYELKETIEVVGRKINFSKTLELAIVQVIESSSQNSNMWKIKYR